MIQAAENSTIITTIGAAAVIVATVAITIVVAVAIGAAVVVVEVVGEGPQLSASLQADLHVHTTHSRDKVSPP